MAPSAPRYHLYTSAVPDETLDTFETTAFSFVFCWFSGEKGDLGEHSSWIHGL